VQEGSTPAIGTGRKRGTPLGVSSKGGAPLIEGRFDPAEDSHVLASSEDSHVLAPTDDQPPMVAVTHLSDIHDSHVIGGYQWHVRYD
jgi:hypothetical protein